MGGDVRRRSERELPLDLEPLRPERSRRHARPRGRPQGLRGDDPGRAVPHGVHSDDQRLVRQRDRCHQRAQPPHPQRRHQGGGGHSANLVPPARRARARLWLGRVGRSRSPVRLLPLHLRLIHLLHLLRPPPQAEDERLAGLVRARRLLHQPPLVVRPGGLRDARQAGVLDSSHPLLDRGAGDCNRQRLQVHRGRQGARPQLSPRGIRHRRRR
mmetsp:Transcript_923/g.1645  ORF Transcript_923/g.1645 Transcript_923/m.1645 type:complete len:213 (+) Transcript_923:375-1013(+)